MELEDDDKEEVKIRHKELITAINSLKSVLSEIPTEKPNDNGVKESIDKLVILLSKVPKPETPVVNISNNNDEVAKIFKEHLSSQPKIEPVKEKEPVSYIHKVISRDRNGFVEKVQSDPI